MSDKNEFKDLRYQDIVAEFNALADYGDSESAGEYIGDLAKTFYAMRDHNTALREENRRKDERIIALNACWENCAQMVRDGKGEIVALTESRKRCVAWLVEWCVSFHFVKTIEGRKELWNGWDSLPDCDVKRECKTIAEGDKS